MSPERAALLAGLSVFAVLTVALNTTLAGWMNWYRIGKSGVMTQAVVTSVEPLNHRNCTLRYVVVGTAYETTASGCSDAPIGTSVRVRYLPSNPSFATTRSPHAELALQIFATVFMSMIAAMITGFRVARQQGAAQQGAPSDAGASRPRG